MSCDEQTLETPGADAAAEKAARYRWRTSMFQASGVGIVHTDA